MESPHRSMGFLVRYGILPASDFSRRVLVGNPAYGIGIGKYGSRPVKPEKHWYEKLEAENGFYTKLERSILEEGFRNPIFGKSIKEGTFCVYGSSRLWIAQKHQLLVPAVIADYTGRWDHLEELKDEEEIRAKFKDQPEELTLDDDLWICHCPHVHLQKEYS